MSKGELKHELSHVTSPNSCLQTTHLNLAKVVDTNLGYQIVSFQVVIDFCSQLLLFNLSFY